MNISSLKKFILFIFLFLSCPVVFATTQLLKIKSVSQNNLTHVVYTLDQATLFRVFTLKNPNRLVIDFKNAHLATSLKNIFFKDTNIKNIRYGYPVPGTLRLVFDLENLVPFKVKSDTTHVAMDIQSSEKSVADIQPIAKKIVTAALPPPPPAPPKKIHITNIIIDPGHGGKDFGATGPNGIKEKDVVLAIGLKLADYLNHEPGMHVEMTRRSDNFVSLRDRLQFAREKKGEVLVSIHADSFNDKQFTGASIYTLSKRGASTVAAHWIARRENSELGDVDLRELEDENRIVRSVLIDLAQVATTRDSLRLGNFMLNALDKVTDLHDKRVEQAPFYVLKSPDIPSILIETGFISNPREEAKLANKNFQKKLAREMFHAVRTYIENSSVG